MRLIPRVKWDGLHSITESFWRLHPNISTSSSRWIEICHFKETSRLADCGRGVAGQNQPLADLKSLVPKLLAAIELAQSGITQIVGA
jgi:hypothetical protein